MRDEEILEVRFDPTCVTSKRASTSEEHSKRLDIALECINLSSICGGEEVLCGLDLAVPSGASFAITGPAGSGKTTLFKTVVGLAPINAGKIHIFGRPAANQKQFVAFMPSWRSINWDFPLTLLDFAMLGIYPKLGVMARPVGRSKQDAYSALRKTRLYEFKDKQISWLSTALRQRALAARMLAQETAIYLLDEPFMGVDAESAEILTDVLRTLKENGKTVLASLRNLNRAEGCFDKVMLLSDGRATAIERFEQEEKEPPKPIVQVKTDTPEPLPPTPQTPEEKKEQDSVLYTAVEHQFTRPPEEYALIPDPVPTTPVPTTPITVPAPAPTPEVTLPTPYTPSFEEIAAGLSDEGFFAEGGGETALPFANVPTYEITPEEFDNAVGEYQDGVFIPSPHKEVPAYHLDSGLPEIWEIPEEEAAEPLKAALSDTDNSPQDTDKALGQGTDSKDTPLQKTHMSVQLLLDLEEKTETEEAPQTISEEAEEDGFNGEGEDLPKYLPPQGLDTEINPVFEIFSDVEQDETVHDPSLYQQKEQDVWSKITEFTRSMGKKKRGK